MKDVLFLDIETVSLTPTWDALPAELQGQWSRKVQVLKREEHPREIFRERAALYAEFGKVVCIGLGGWDRDGFHLNCLYDHDEHILLQDFKRRLERHPAGRKLVLCAHNGKEFDFPYLCRRMLIQGIRLPEVLLLSGKKPWEIPHRDTMEMWKFGDHKQFTSLDLLAAILGVQSRMGGDKVQASYYEGGALEQIAAYCMEDVLALARVYARLSAAPEIHEEQVIRSHNPGKN